MATPRKKSPKIRFRVEGGVYIDDPNPSFNLNHPIKTKTLLALRYNGYNNYTQKSQLKPDKKSQKRFKF